MATKNQLAKIKYVIEVENGKFVAKLKQNNLIRKRNLLSSYSNLTAPNLIQGKIRVD